MLHFLFLQSLAAFLIPIFYAHLCHAKKRVGNSMEVMRFPCLLFGDDHDLDLLWLIYVDICGDLWSNFLLLSYMSDLSGIYLYIYIYIHEHVYLSNSMIIWWSHHIVIITIQWYIIIIYICMTHDICREPGLLSSLEQLKFPENMSTSSSCGGFNTTCWWKESCYPVEVGSLSHYLQGFVHPRRLLGISSINTINIKQVGITSFFCETSQKLKLFGRSLWIISGKHMFPKNSAETLRVFPSFLSTGWAFPTLTTKTSTNSRRAGR